MDTTTNNNTNNNATNSSIKPTEKIPDSVWDKVDSKNILETTRAPLDYILKTELTAIQTRDGEFERKTLIPGSYDVKSEQKIVKVATTNSFVRAATNILVDSRPSTKKRAMTSIGYKLLSANEFPNLSLEQIGRVLELRKKLIVKYMQLTYRAFAISMSGFAQDTQQNTFKNSIGQKQIFDFPSFKEKLTSKGRSKTYISKPKYTYRIAKKNKDGSKTRVERNGEVDFMSTIAVAYHKMVHDGKNMEKKVKASTNVTQQYLMEFGKLRSTLFSIESLFNVVSNINPFMSESVIPFNFDVVLSPFSQKSPKPIQEMAKELFRVGSAEWKEYRQSSDKHLQYVLKDGVLSLAGTNSFEASICKRIVVFSTEDVEKAKLKFDEEEEDEEVQFSPVDIDKTLGDIYIDGILCAINENGKYEEVVDENDKNTILKYSTIKNAGFIRPLSSKTTSERTIHLPRFTVFSSSISQHSFPEENSIPPKKPRKPTLNDFGVSKVPTKGEDMTDEEFSALKNEYNENMYLYEDSLSAYKVEYKEYKKQKLAFTTSLKPIAEIIEEKQSLNTGDLDDEDDMIDDDDEDDYD